MSLNVSITNASQLSRFVMINTTVLTELMNKIAVGGIISNNNGTIGIYFIVYLLHKVLVI